MKKINLENTANENFINNDAFQNYIQEETKKRMQEFDETLSKLTDKLAPLGWTLPTELGVYAINVLGNTNEIEDINKFFYDFYTYDDGINFKILLETIDKSMIEDQFKKAVKECVFSFKNCKYIITVNTLLAVIEGMLSRFYENKDNIQMMRVCREIVEKSEQSDSNNGSIEKYIWKSYLNFITSLYTKSSFSENEPQGLNRHWLLHGRSEYNVTEVECYKLFNAICTLSVAVNQSKKHRD